ncbi:protein of unknown function [Georgfuchsia toluolica]|uniref:Uncharacterized protein n=1 Tax=Georgfuchsia toluolica TaxID=424218 RepID=A0A916J301_9PROT|nr:protein of unknown function [Georgfuchsia toluolica]
MAFAVHAKEIPAADFDVVSDLTAVLLSVLLRLMDFVMPSTLASELSNRTWVMSGVIVAR